MTWGGGRRAGRGRGRQRGRRCRGTWSMGRTEILHWAPPPHLRTRPALISKSSTQAARMHIFRGLQRVGNHIRTLASTREELPPCWRAPGLHQLPPLPPNSLRSARWEGVSCPLEQAAILGFSTCARSALCIPLPHTQSPHTLSSLPRHTASTGPSLALWSQSTQGWAMLETGLGSNLGTARRAWPCLCTSREPGSLNLFSRSLRSLTGAAFTYHQRAQDGQECEVRSQEPGGPQGTTSQDVGYSLHFPICKRGGVRGLACEIWRLSVCPAQSCPSIDRAQWALQLPGP